MADISISVTQEVDAKNIQQAQEQKTVDESSNKSTSDAKSKKTKLHVSKDSKPKRRHSCCEITMSIHDNKPKTMESALVTAAGMGMGMASEMVPTKPKKTIASKSKSVDYSKKESKKSHLKKALGSFAKMQYGIPFALSNESANQPDLDT